MKIKLLTYLLFSLTASVYASIAYQIERSNFLFLMAGIFLLFATYFILYKKNECLSKSEIFTAGIIFRLLFLFSIPTLSDDFFRFIWDGQLTAKGFNPYIEKPNEAIHYFGENLFFNELISEMNSPNYYTVYPPLNQFFFFVAAKIGSENILINVIVMRIIILISEIGSMILLLKLNLNKKYFLLYSLNPLIIIELCGNLHFEGVMIFFIIASIYFLKRNGIFASAIFLGMAISVKLIPFIILPFIAIYLKIKKGVLFTLVCVLLVLLFFLPFLSAEFILHITNSLQLYFLTFEFNASIYYIIREIGLLLYGYNIISIAGKLLPLITMLILSILLFNQYKKNNAKQLFTSLLFAIFTYYLFSSVVHPWYISTLVLLGIFSNYTFPFVWSGLIFLSYHAYGKNFFSENLLFVSTEYLLLIGYFFYEIRSRKNQIELTNEVL